jgi:hypothetical protein
MTLGWRTCKMINRRKAVARLASLACLPALLPSDVREGSSGAVPKEPQVSDPLGLLPSRVLLTVAADPARTQAVTWRTDSVTPGLAQLARALSSPDLKNQAATIEAVSVLVDTGVNSRATYHKALFKDLQPGTEYAYRVGHEKAWSEWNHFTTAHDETRPFSFIYMGDAQNGLKSVWSRVIREAYRRCSDARFVLHVGDLVEKGNVDIEWDRWFSAAGWINRELPCLAIPGNHEYPNRGWLNPRILSKLWKCQFQFPQNGPPGLEGTAYFLDYQGTRIVCLNSNEQLDVQAQWLDKVLSENPQKWTILALHHPLYSIVAHRDNPVVRKTWLPIIDKHKVDLVLQGHDHTYSRSKSLKSCVPVRDTESGTVYAVSVSGSKMYDAISAPHSLMDRIAEFTQLYQIISVDGDILKYEARTPSGEPYDRFELHKIADGGSRLVNQAPSLPAIYKA